MTTTTRRQERIGGAASRRAGDHAPEFTLAATDGQTVSLAAQLRKGPVILCFLDGRQVQLVTLSGCAAQIEAQGGTLLAISPDASDAPGNFRALHDAGGAVTRHYGISTPTTFVIDQAATIVLSLIVAAPGNALTCNCVMSALSALRRIGERRP
jgi:peroxiredoxin